MEEHLTTRIEERRWDVDDYYLIVKVQVSENIFTKGDEVEVTVRKAEPSPEEPKEIDEESGGFLYRAVRKSHDQLVEESEKDNPDGEVDIPPEAAAIGMMHPIDEDHEPPVPEGKDFDGSVESLMQKANLSEEPVKCCKCSRKMDDPEGWVEGLNNHMWCPGCQPDEEPEKEVEPPFKSITVRPITPPQWVRWGDVWVCSMCGHQMAAGHEGQLPEKCPSCGASMEGK